MGTLSLSSGEEAFEMVRDMHVEGESQAGYYLGVYAEAALCSDDNNNASEAELYYYSLFGHAREHRDDSNFSDASGAEPTSSSSSSSSSSSFSASNDPQIKWFQTVSQSSIWDPSLSSQHDDDDVDKENDLDDLFGPDPILQVFPVDYSEDRKHHLNRAAGPKHDPKHADPWLYSNWSKQQCLLPHTEAISNESAPRVEAYRDLLGRDPPRPPPPAAPRYRLCEYQPPARWYNGSWWLPPTEWRRVTMRPGSLSDRRRRIQSRTPGGDDKELWAQIPCACWHCEAHPWSESSRPPLFDRTKVLGQNFVEYALPR